jgi:hypothetical protein
LPEACFLTLESTIWLISAVAEASVLVLVIQRKLWRTLPIFSIYVAWTLLSDVAYFLLGRQHLSQEVLLNVYTLEVTIDSLLQFAVLVELFWSVLRPVRASLPKSSLFILTVLLAIAGAVIWPIAGMAVPDNLLPRMSLLYHLMHTFAILRVICFLVMASFSQLLSIGWKDRELQVATGLGLYSIVSLIVAVLETHHLTHTQSRWLDNAETIGYVCTLSYWVLSFVTKEQERKEFSPQMQQVLVLMGGGARAGRVALTDMSAQNRRKKDK